MPWQRFLLFNALGGITWAATVGTLAYLAGDGVEKIVRDFGLGALAVLAVAAAALLIVHRRRRRSRVGTHG
jgi:membrane protein DedA with SNARE-associated domain